MKILITGASGGLGIALAKAWSAPNNTLILLGRNLEKLLETASICCEMGATVEVIIADILDKNYEDIIQNIANKYEFDLVIANAGINLLERFSKIKEGAIDNIANVIEINFSGQIKTIFPLINGLAKNGGQIVIISSISAFRGLPQDPAYSASKIALSTFFEGCRANWLALGIGVTIVYPGFIETAMSAKVTSPKPFCISPFKAAKIIQKGVCKRKLKIVFPLRLRILFNLQSLLPASWLDRILLLF